MRSCKTVLNSTPLMGQADKARTVRFGPFEVNTASGELSRDGHTIKIQQQPLQILLTLLSRSGEVVTREELRQKTGGTEAVEDIFLSLTGESPEKTDLMKTAG